MPTGIIHPFWIEALKEAASEILNAGFVVVSLVATPKGPPAANGHSRRLAIPLRGRLVVVCPSDRFGHQVKPRGTVHQRSIPGRGYALLQSGRTDSAAAVGPTVAIDEQSGPIRCRRRNARNAAVLGRWGLALARCCLPCVRGLGGLNGVLGGPIALAS